MLIFVTSFFIFLCFQSDCRAFNKYPENDEWSFRFQVINFTLKNKIFSVFCYFLGEKVNGILDVWILIKLDNLKMLNCCSPAVPCNSMIDNCFTWLQIIFTVKSWDRTVVAWKSLCLGPGSENMTVAAKIIILHSVTVTFCFTDLLFLQVLTVEI